MADSEWGLCTGACRGLRGTKPDGSSQAGASPCLSFIATGPRTQPTLITASTIEATLMLTVH